MKKMLFAFLAVTVSVIAAPQAVVFESAHQVRLELAKRGVF